MIEKPEKRPAQEVELKLKLDERSYQEISTLFPVQRPAVLQENWFFDSEDYLLLRQCWALRIRKEEAAYYLTAKGPAERDNGVFIRPEYECRLTAEQALACRSGFRLSSLPLEPLQELCKRWGDLLVKPLFSFTNLRQFFEFDGWVLELDRTLIKEQVFFELEVEASPESLSLCRQKLEHLFREHDWVYAPSHESKMEKALRLFLNR